VTATDESHQEHFEEMIRGNRRIIQKDITLKLEASEERVGHIINTLGFRKIYTSWALQKLTGEISAAIVRI
jgi:hypothetical protein